MLPTRLLPISCVFFALTVSSAQAQAAEEVTLPQIRTVLNDLQIKFEETNDKKDPGKAVYFDFKFEDYEMTLFRFSDSLLIQAHFSGVTTLDIANRWNQSNQFGRVYLDKNNHPFVEADLPFEGGVTPTSLKAFIVRFPNTIDSLVDLLDPPKDETKETSANAAQFPVFSRPDSGKTKFDAAFGGCTLWYDAKKWTPQADTKTGRREFHYVNGQGFAIVMTEGLPIPLASFEQVALINAKTSTRKQKLCSASAAKSMEPRYSH